MLYIQVLKHYRPTFAWHVKQLTCPAAFTLLSMGSWSVWRFESSVRHHPVVQSNADQAPLPAAGACRQQQSDEFAAWLISM